jgi:hypothetical protein
MYYPLFATECSLFLRSSSSEHSQSGSEPGCDGVTNRNRRAKKGFRPGGNRIQNLFYDMWLCSRGRNSNCGSGDETVSA